MLQGYQPLTLHSELSADARQLVRDQLEMQLADVHAMLRLPLPHDEGLSAGCNFAATQVLLSVVSGTSVTLFDPAAMSKRGNRGAAFKRLIESYYPWDQELETSGVRSGKDASSDLYDLFRNPLAHSLGFIGETDNFGGTIILIEKCSMREAEIVDLEMTQSNERRWLDPTLTLSDGFLKLRVASLYWGVREMIERVVRESQACSFAFARNDARSRSA